MSARGPGEAPPVVRRRARRNRKPPQAKPLAARPPRHLAKAAEPKVRIPRPQARPLQAQPPRSYAPAAEPKVRITRPTRPQAPTATQLRSARAQRAGYVSQGKAVDRAAYQGKTVKQRRQVLKQAWATPEAKRTAAQRAAISVHHERAAGAAAERARGFGQTHTQALAARDAIVSSAAAVTSAAKAADRAAEKVAKQPEVKKEKPLKVGGISLGIKPSVAKAAITHAPGFRNVLMAAKALDKAHADVPAEAALKNLDRPRNAVMTSLKADIKRGGVKEAFFGIHAPGSKAAKERRKAISRGVQLKEHPSGGDVLKAAGVKNKAVRAAGGFALDTAVSAATLPAGGVGSQAARAGEKAAARQLAAGARDARVAARGARRGAVARGATPAEAKAAGKAARRVAKQRARTAAERARTRAIDPDAAYKHVVTLRGKANRLRAAGKVKEAERVEKRVKKARRAAKQARRHEGKGQGIGVRIIGHEIAGSRRATAAVGRKVRKATGSAAPMTEAERTAAKGFSAAERSARAGKEQAMGRAKRVAQRALRDLSPEEHQQVIHALDTGNIKSLGNDKLIRAATDLRSAFRHEFKAERQVGVSAVRHPEDFLSKDDLDKLGKTAKKQQRRAERAAGRAATREAETGADVRLRQSEAQLRAEGSTRVAQEKAVVRARDAHKRAKKALRNELAKPVTRRKGVAVLEARVRQTRATWKNARAATPAVAPRTGRVGVAAERQEVRAGTRAEHEARAEATKNLPKRGRGQGVPITETHKAWLQRVRRYAQQHDLPLVERRADKLLAKAPKAEDIARGYFPREFPSRAEQQAGVAEKGAVPEGGARAVRTGTARSTAGSTGGRARTDPRRFDILQAEGKGFSENVPLVAGSRVRTAGRAVAEADFARNVARTQGRRVTSAGDLKEGERLYVLGERGGKYGLHPAKNIGKDAAKQWRDYDEAVRRGVPDPRAPEPGSPQFRDVVTKINRVEELAQRGATAGEQAAARAARDRVLARNGLRLRNGRIEANRVRPDIPKPKVPRSVVAGGKGRKPGQFYAIPERAVERMNAANAPMPALDSKFLRAVDKVTGGFKWATTYSPAFHLRNAYGDVQRLMEMPGNPLMNVGKLSSGAKAARGIRQAERYRQATGKVLGSDPLHKATIKVAGEDMPVRDFIKMLDRHKLRDVGRAQQERIEAAAMRGDRRVEEGNILRGGGLRSRGGLFRGQVGRVLSQDTPNAIRAAAFKAGLDQGLTETQAAERAHAFFVDYGALSHAERQIGRRIFPFYTWTRKSLPVTLQNYVLNPARYANLNAARQEWNTAVTGLSTEELEAQMKDYTRNNLPIIIPVGGGNYAAISASWPANLVQFVPSGIGPKAAYDDLGRFRSLGGSMLSWPVKTIIDAASGQATHGAGFDIKTGRAIQDPYSPRVPAPSWVKDLPEWLKKDLMVDETATDKATGKKQLKWGGWANWAYRNALLGVPRQVAGFADTARTGHINTNAARAAEFLGVTVEQVNKDVQKQAERIKLVKRSAELNKRLQALPEGVGKDRPTAEWRRLRDELNKVEKVLRPSKPKASTSSGPTLKDIGLGSTDSGVTLKDIGLGG